MPSGMKPWAIYNGNTEYVNTCNSVNPCLRQALRDQCCLNGCDETGKPGKAGNRAYKL